jgi:hypothetical protein
MVPVSEMKLCSGIFVTIERSKYTSDCFDKQEGNSKKSSSNNEKERISPQDN